MTETPSAERRAEVGARIEAARNRLFRSRRQAAANLDIDEALIRQWERGFDLRRGVELPVVVPRQRLAQMYLKGWFDEDELGELAALLGYERTGMTIEIGREMRRLRDEAAHQPTVGYSSGYFVPADMKVVEAPDAVLLNELAHRLSQRPNRIPDIDWTAGLTTGTVGSTGSTEEAEPDIPVGPALYDLAAHTDEPGYVRDYERDAAPDEGA